MGRGGGRAEEFRDVVEENRGAVERGELKLERNPFSNTKFTNVIFLPNVCKYQARLQVPGDGRGGTAKRKQYPLPAAGGEPNLTVHRARPIEQLQHGTHGLQSQTPSGSKFPGSP